MWRRERDKKMQNNINTEYGKVEVLWDPPDEQPQSRDEIKISSVVRVAAYCRVSTELDEQTDSFELQERYYARLITNTPGWRLAGIYADQGITGTERRQRVGFQRLIRHCEEGKIDRILCKSISRFARNTLDLLEIVRQLKDLGISVIFEKEGIDTLSVQSEFLLSTIAAIAQEESRSISENMTWSFKKRFQRGIPVFKRILGYDVKGRGIDKIISINEKEAAIVREIFSLALDGVGYTDIARIMMQKGYKTLDGNTEWTIDRVKGILKNERYTGNALCQKTYTANYLTHKTIRNKGEKQQYFIENHHPPIISREIFEAVQNLFKGKQNSKPPKPNVYPFSGRMICGECGATYHRYNSSGNASWACSRRKKSRNLCKAESVTEADVEKALLKAFVERYDVSDKNLIHKIKLDIKRLQDNDNIEQNRVILKRELTEVLYKETHASDEERKAATEHRIIIEEKLKDLEGFWVLLEKDRSCRAKALAWIDKLPRGENRMKTFFEEFNGMYMRAWVISITVLSPMLFKIKWFDNTETTVDIN